MIVITDLQKSHVAAAKILIAKGAFNFFKDADNFSDFFSLHEKKHEFDDIINFEEFYYKNRGIFLVALDNDNLIGTGALCQLVGGIAELRRLWLLEEYHGQGIGFQLTKKLIEFATKKKFSKICLQTNHIQMRAVAFYKKLGFYEIKCYNEETGDDLSMEIELK